MQSIELVIIHPTADGNHYKNHLCQGICTRNESSYSIQLMETKKWFDEHKFHLSPGDQLSTPETNRSFTVTAVTYAEKRPKYAIVSATLNQPIDGGLAS